MDGLGLVHGVEVGDSGMSGVITASSLRGLAAELFAAQAPVVGSLILSSVLASLALDGGFVAGVLGLGCGLIVGSAVHEIGHAVFYWRTCGDESSVRVGHRWGLAMWVEFPDSTNTRLVALGGPLIPAALGVMVGALGLWLGVPWLVAFAVGLVFHLAGLLPGSRDGDRIWGLSLDD